MIKQHLYRRGRRSSPLPPQRRREVPSEGLSPPAASSLVELSEDLGCCLEIRHLSYFPQLQLSGAHSEWQRQPLPLSEPRVPKLLTPRFAQDLWSRNGFYYFSLYFYHLNKASCNCIRHKVIYKHIIQWRKTPHTDTHIHTHVLYYAWK